MNNNRRKIFQTIVVMALCVLYLIQYPPRLTIGFFRRMFMFGDPVRWIRYILTIPTEYSSVYLMILLISFLFILCAIRLVFLLVRGRVEKEKNSDALLPAARRNNLRAGSGSRQKNRRAGSKARQNGGYADMIPTSEDRYMKQLASFLESGLITKQEYLALISHHERER